METPKVLVAGISPKTVALARAAFEPLGYQIITAQPMSVALFLAHKNLPELIICPYEMLDGDGQTFLTEVQRDDELCQIPFVFCIEELPETSAEFTAIRDGASKVVSNLLTPAEFLGLVMPLIDERLASKGKRAETTPE